MKTRQAAKVSVLIISMILVSGAFSSLSGLEITVGQSAVVRGDTVRLADVAQFDPSNDSRISQLKGIEISASPQPGSNVSINKDLIIYKINPYISGEKDILIKLPETLVLKRSAQFVSSDLMKEIFAEYVKANSSWSEREMTFEDINTQESVALPEGKLQWEVQEKDNSDLIGNVSLTVAFSVDGKLVKKVPLSGKVGVMMEMIKAARRIDKGQIITAGDMITISEKAFHLKKEAVADMKDIIGKRSLRAIQADQTILFSMIENPPLVKKGDKVIINAENSELRITAAGEALQDGETGEIVEVLNTQSGKKVVATVTGSGTVKVVF
jgi:flagellar basal body P-ring formation protein FlgA